MAGEAVERERRRVGEQHEGADSDPEVPVEDRGVDDVAPEKGQVAERQVEEVAMQVLEDEGERRLTPVAGASHLRDGAGRRVEEEGAVVGLPIVVAGGAEEHRRHEDQEGGREGKPVDDDEGRVEGREVVAREVVPALEGGPVRIADQGREADPLDEWRHPPCIAPMGGGKACTLELAGHGYHRAGPSVSSARG